MKARIAYEERQYDQAKECCKKVLKLNPKCIKST